MYGVKLMKYTNMVSKGKCLNNSNASKFENTTSNSEIMIKTSTNLPIASAKST